MTDASLSRDRRQRDVPMFSALTFRYPFRKYQRLILAHVDSDPTDHKYHLVAPPGSGKTIVGLELIRRFGRPAVVFAPTTTIQMQWRERVAMFTDEPEQVAALTSLEPQKLAPINIFTYQLIATTGQSPRYVRQMAVQRWLEDLLEEGQVADDDAAQARLETLRQNNPRAYRKELSRRYLRIKRDLLRRENADIAHFLHPNARQLIQSLVDYGVGTVVLDECHHLLDYWAIVLRHLINALGDPRVIGLTATLPSPEGDAEYENYTSLLGEVDFEVPTPAVVKEGDLAPYRDLVYFVEPSEREYAYLNNIQAAFDTAIRALADRTVFQNWVIGSVLEHANSGDASQASWDEFLINRPLFSLAALRFLRRIDYRLPAHLPVPQEAQEDSTLQDWASLLERYGLDVLKVSPHADDHRELARLRRSLQPFGLTLTERGLRQSRSPGDLVLTFSESKDAAVADILAAESQALGDRLRAVVVTDFERLSSGVSRLGGVMDRDAGSARRVFRHLVVHPAAGTLDPILVTGRVVLVDADHGDALLERFNRFLREQGLRAICRYRDTDSPQILQVTGEGRDWSSRTYVRMVTAAFEQGVTRCLVGTRGIFGEGWDSLALNTLVDLTSVTTSTAVQQLRGRSIRKDPRWPRKVAHNWDVVCVAPTFKQGDHDLRRFIRRHNRYWGIVPPSRTAQVVQDAMAKVDSVLAAGQADPLDDPLSGQIVRGILHVSPRLAFDLSFWGFKWTDYDGLTNRMLSQVNRRDQIYELWRIGDEYSNFTYRTTQLDARDLRIRTVHTVGQTLKRMLRSFRASVAAGLLLSLFLGLRASLEGLAAGGSLPALFSLAVGVLAVGTVLTLLLNLRGAYRIGRALLVEQPPDAILLDAGRALLAALKAAGLVSANLQSEYVRVVETPDQRYQVLCDYAAPVDAAVFIQAYRQMFEPVRDQRYLIHRDDGRLPSLGLTSLWLVLRPWFRDKRGYHPAYHPVPKVLATRKARAQAFARYWKQFVGGGQLVYTRSEAGRKILLQARAQQRPKVKSLAFEFWR